MNPQGPQMQLTREQIHEIVHALQTQVGVSAEICSAVEFDGTELARKHQRHMERCAQIHGLLLGASQVSV